MKHALRYYAPNFTAATHAEIVRLLDEVERRHGIRREIREIPRKSGSDPSVWIPDEGAQRELYERDFRPRAAVLKNRIGEPLRRLLRSRSGGYFVTGTVAITKLGQVEWFASYATPFPHLDADPTLGFLKAVLESGPNLLEQLTPLVTKGAPEARILDAFIAARCLEGSCAREVKVGKRRFSVDGAEMDWRKAIDLVYRTSEDTWVLEGKTRLNYEALGEVLTYGVLYAADHTSERVKLGIVCGSLDEEILEACRTFAVTVFQVIGDAVKQIPDSPAHPSRAS